MNQSMVIQITKDALTVALMVSAPLLLVGMVVGVLVSIFQAVTSIQEMTLTFVPKVLAAAAAAIIFGPWMLNTMITYTAGMLSSLPSMAR